MRERFDIAYLLTDLLIDRQYCEISRKLVAISSGCSDLVQRLVSMHSRHLCWDLCSQSVLDTSIAGTSTSIMAGTSYLQWGYSALEYTMLPP